MLAKGGKKNKFILDIFVIENILEQLELKIVLKMGKWVVNVDDMVEVDHWGCCGHSSRKEDNEVKQTFYK